MPMEELLAQLRRSATMRLSSRDESPWALLQHRKLIEHIDKILKGKTTSDDVPHLRRARCYAAWPT